MRSLPTRRTDSCLGCIPPLRLFGLRWRRTLSDRNRAHPFGRVSRSVRMIRSSGLVPIPELDRRAVRVFSRVLWLLLLAQPKERSSVRHSYFPFAGQVLPHGWQRAAVRVLYLLVLDAGRVWFSRRQAPLYSFSGATICFFRKVLRGASLDSAVLFSFAIQGVLCATFAFLQQQLLDRRGSACAAVRRTLFSWDVYPKKQRWLDAISLSIFWSRIAFCSKAIRQDIAYNLAWPRLYAKNFASARSFA